VKSVFAHAEDIFVVGWN